MEEKDDEGVAAGPAPKVVVLRGFNPTVVVTDAAPVEAPCDDSAEE